MNHGGSTADIIIVATFCKDLYRKCRDAGGEYDEISREVRALHTVLKHLKYEVEAPESPLNRDRPRWSRQLSSLINDCDHTLRQLDNIIVKYGRLAEPSSNGSPSTSRVMWDKVRFGSTELDQLGATRVRLISHKSNLTLFLDTIQLHQNEAMQATLDNHGGQLDRILDKVDGIAARMGQHNGSVMTSYDDDDKEVWKQFRRELVAEGFSSDVLQQHKDVLRAYIREIDQKGLLEEVAVDPKQPLTKVGGINPERWLDSVQTDGSNLAPSINAMSIGSDGSGDKQLLSTENNAKYLPSIKTSHGQQEMPGRYLSPIIEQPRRNSDGERPRTMPRLETHNRRDLAIYHSDSSSDDNTSQSLVRTNPSSKSLVIRTTDLFAGNGGIKAGDTLIPKSSDLQVEYGSSPNWRDTLSAPESAIKSLPDGVRLAPDEFGNEIPADAKWTKVRRTLISTEVLDQDRRRYEARPDFVAVLGVLTRAEIEDLAERTAAHRRARHLRHHPPPTLTPQPSDIPPKQPPRPGSSFKPVPVPIPVPIPFSGHRSRREDTPSSTDYTNSSDSEGEPSRSRLHPTYRPGMRNKKPSYAGSDAGSVHGYPNPFGQPVPPPSPILSRDGDRPHERDRMYKDVNGGTTVFTGMPRSAPEGDRDQGVRFGNPSYYTHEPQLPARRSDDHDRRRERDWEFNRAGEEQRREHHRHDHHRSRDDRPRDERRRNERDRGHSRRNTAERGPNKEVEQMKKKRWKENLTAAGIGGAAVSLLNVLSEAAEGI